MMNTQISLNQGKIMVAGELTFSSVQDLWEKSKMLFPQQGEWVCDFAQVSSCDSAGLSLLFEWIKLAKQRGRKLRLLQVPKQLLSLATAAGLNKILEQYT